MGAAELFLPVYIILFLLLIRRLDVIPYRVDYTPAAAAAPKHSIFSPPPPPLWQRPLTEKEKEDLEKMKSKLHLDTDPVRIGVAPLDGVLAKRVAAGLCQVVEGMKVGRPDFKAAFGTGSPCYGVAMYTNGQALYKAKGRFDNPESGLDIGVIIDEKMFNFTLVHHEFMLLNTTSMGSSEAAALSNGLLMYQSLISSMIAPDSVRLFPAPVLNPSPMQTLTPYVQEFPTAERWDEVNALKYIFSMQFIQVLVFNYMGPMIRMAQEKEKGIKHALLLKGMSPLAFWLTWFISESITVFFSTCITVSCLYACQHFIYTNAGWVFLAFLLFGCAFACFGFMCSFLAEKAYTLSMFAALFNLILLALYGVTQFYLINGQKVNQHVIHLLFLIAPVPFGHIMYEMINTELWKKARTPEILRYRGTSYRKSLES